MSGQCCATWPRCPGRSCAEGVRGNRAFCAAPLTGRGLLLLSWRPRHAPGGSSLLVERRVRREPLSGRGFPERRSEISMRRSMPRRVPARWRKKPEGPGMRAPRMRGSGSDRVRVDDARAGRSSSIICLGGQGRQSRQGPETWCGPREAASGRRIPRGPEKSPRFLDELGA